ncbi:unnamed protein product [Brassicogethes aeneus]|uniref:Uncharacterized protein n=1 Tax=Brassicogethes aeneus TaxID=1431903 RepID=A0A9P0B017_BRAAE|nr:unnamed protein product [Brassicogethes aeneus]
MNLTKLRKDDLIYELKVRDVSKLQGERPLSMRKKLEELMFNEVFGVLVSCENFQPSVLEEVDTVTKKIEALENFVAENQLVVENVHFKTAETMLRHLTARLQRIRIGSTEDDKPIECTISNLLDIVHETMDRIKRSNNVIIHGLPESTSSTEDRKKSDLDSAKNILSVISADLNTNFLDIIRIGKPTSGKKRPLKFASKLANSVYKHINITNDKTPKKMEYLKKLSDELKQRTDSGEPNLKIKYIKGVPNE